MALKLFRRHGKDCSKKYSKEDRVHEFDSLKTTGKVQCNCPISVDGKLADSYLKAKATGCRDWESARRVVVTWERAGEPSSALLPRDASYELITVERTVESFYMVQRNKDICGARLKQYEQLLTLRLIPFAQSRNLQYIQEMDKALVWAEFRNSWENQNPLRNKKPVEGKPIPRVSVGKRTASRMIGDLRIFLNHCISNEWLSENWAHKQHGMVTSKVKDPKDPFSDVDILYIYRAAEHVTDGRRHTGTQNGFEDLVFAFVLRYTGLRISDVCMMKVSQLVPFRHGGRTPANSRER